MAKKSQKSATPVVEQFNLTIMQNQRQVKELTDWKRAISAAESLHAPQRKTLYDLYLNVVLDTHVSAVLQKRVLAVTNVSWSVVDSEGKPLNDFNDALDSTFFEDILTYIIEARLYGHSLVQIDWHNRTVELVPRAHVNPRAKLVVPNPLLWGQGISYAEPPYTYLTIEAGKPDDLGLLIKVAPFAIMKRNDISDWATFCEVFGMPLRVGYYDSTMPTHRTEMEKAMKEMGAAGYLVLPDGGRIEFPSANNSGTGNDTYDRFADFCNKEISKAIVGQTMTTEDGASLSQSQVHLKAEDRIAQNDLKYVERLLNERLIPLMLAQGVVLPQGARFQPVEEEQELDRKTRLEMDLQIHREVGRLPKTYFQQEYNVEFVDNSDEPDDADQPTGGTPPTNVDTPKEKTTTGKQKTPNNKLQDLFETLSDFFVQATAVGRPQVAPTTLEVEIEHLYYHHCCGDENQNLNDSPNDLTPAPPAFDLKKITERALKNVYAGLAGSIEPETWELAAQTMMAAVQEGVWYNYNTPNLPLALKLGQSGLWFAAQRSYTQADNLAQLLNKNGTKRSFSEFKKFATPIIGKYNNQWLKTEYITALRSARVATIWEDMLRAAHLYPNVEYIRSRAANPRESHLKYVGIIRPITDPWWRTHTPPLDWRCLCSIKPTAKPPTDLPANLPAPKAGLANNSAIDQTLFSEDHPYTQKAKAVESELKKEFYDLRGQMGQYFKVRTPKGEIILVHPAHTESDIPLNLPTAVALAEEGRKTILPTHLKDKTKPDLIVDNIISDLKEPGSDPKQRPDNLSSSVRKQIEKANKQQVQQVVMRFNRALVDYSAEDIVDGLRRGLLHKGQPINSKIQMVLLIDQNLQTITITREDFKNESALVEKLKQYTWSNKKDNL